jgi:hypothetical protein
VSADSQVRRNRPSEIGSGGLLWLDGDAVNWNAFGPGGNRVPRFVVRCCEQRGRTGHGDLLGFLHEDAQVKPWRGPGDARHIAGVARIGDVARSRVWLCSQPAQKARSVVRS